MSVYSVSAFGGNQWINMTEDQRNKTVNDAQVAVDILNGLEQSKWKPPAQVFLENFTNGFVQGFSTIPKGIIDGSGDILKEATVVTTDIVKDVSGSITETLFSNPLFLIIGAGAIILLIKK